MLLYADNSFTVGGDIEDWLIEPDTPCLAVPEISAVMAFMIHLVRMLLAGFHSAQEFLPTHIAMKFRFEIM